MVAEAKFTVPTTEENSKEIKITPENDSSAVHHEIRGNFVNDGFENDEGNIQIKPADKSISPPVNKFSIATTEAKTVTENGDDNKKEENFIYSCLCIRNKFIQKVFNKPIFFLLMLCCGAFTQGFVVTGITFTSITSIERHFGIKSTEIGLYSTTFDIAYGLCCLFVGYFGHVHKPRFIGFGMILMTIGSFLYTIPKYMYGSYIARLDNYIDVCNITKSSATECVEESRWYYRFFFFLANILLGIGAIPLATLGTAHIYEITKPAQSGLYLAMFYASALIGPGIGFIVGLPILDTWVDIEKPAHMIVTPENNNWVGAWWLGYLLGCILLFLPAIPMLGFPKRFPNTDKLRMKKNEMKDTVVLDKKLKHDLKSAWPATKILLQNKTFMCICLAGATESLASAGFSTFIAKFIETQFHFTSSDASLYTGIIILPGGIIGVLSGGYILKRWTWTCKNILCLGTIVAFISIIPILSVLVGCDSRDVVGSKNDLTPLYSENNTLLAACNADCNCNTRYYKPICSVAEQKTFFSRCHAGCTSDNFMNGKLYNCSCISNATYATDGRCNIDCSLFPLFAIGCFLLIAIGFLNNVPLLYAVFRVVPEGQGSFAMGFQQVFIRFLGFIPAPTVFGKLIDQSCSLWHPDECTAGETRNCLEYNNPDFRLYIFILGLVTKFLTFVFVFLAYIFYIPPINKNMKQETVIKIDKGTNQIAVVPVVSS